MYYTANLIFLIVTIVPQTFMVEQDHMWHPIAEDLAFVRMAHEAVKRKTVPLQRHGLALLADEWDESDILGWSPNNCVGPNQGVERKDNLIETKNGFAWYNIDAFRNWCFHNETNSFQCGSLRLTGEGTSVGFKRVWKCSCTYNGCITPTATKPPRNFWKSVCPVQPWQNGFLSRNTLHRQRVVRDVHIPPTITGAVPRQVLRPFTSYSCNTSLQNADLSKSHRLINNFGWKPHSCLDTDVSSSSYVGKISRTLDIPIALRFHPSSAQVCLRCVISTLCISNCSRTTIACPVLWEIWLFIALYILPRCSFRNLPNSRLCRNSMSVFENVVQCGRCVAHQKFSTGQSQ